MSNQGSGVTFSAWRGDEYIPLIELLLTCGRSILDASWRIRNGEFADGWRESDELNAMSSQINRISTATLVDLVSDGVQMIGGELEAFGRGEEKPFLVLKSVRGDEWDVHTSESYLLDAMRRTYDVVDLP